MLEARLNLIGRHTNSSEADFWVVSFCGEEEAESCLFWILSGRNENSELSDFSWSTKGLSVGDIGQVVNMRLDVGSVQMWMVEVEKVKEEEGRSRRRQK